MFIFYFYYYSVDYAYFLNISYYSSFILKKFNSNFGYTPNSDNLSKAFANFVGLLFDATLNFDPQNDRHSIIKS